QTWNILDVLRDIAHESNKSVAQIALRWLMQRPGVTTPIVGASKLRHLQDNLGATSFELNENQMARLDKASENPQPYPYGFIRPRT
ncbi:MAG: aldo/keto reductase, partial [Anaerolineales bacterium]